MFFILVNGKFVGNESYTDRRGIDHEGREKFVDDVRLATEYESRMIATQKARLSGYKNAEVIDLQTLIARRTKKVAA